MVELAPPIKRFVMHFEEKSQSVDDKLNPITKVDLENKQHRRMFLQNAVQLDLYVRRWS